MKYLIYIAFPILSLLSTCLSSDREPARLDEGNLQSSGRFDDSTTKIKIVNKLSGYWQPVYYTIANVYGRDTNDIKTLMESKTLISSDSIVLFQEDTLLCISIKNIDTTKKSDWLFRNIDAGKREMLNSRLDQHIYSINMSCRKRKGKGDTSTYLTTYNISYDNRSIILGRDGIIFLLSKDTLLK